MTAATLNDLRDSLAGPSPEYRAKQLHPVPDAKVIDRAEFIVERCRGKVVLDIGASGTMHEAIMRASEFCYGIEKPGVPAVVRGDCIFYIDLDDYHATLPQNMLRPGFIKNELVDVIVCGEVIEHLSNPGWFLKRLRAAYKCPVIITVPNAFADAGRASLDRKSIENCNSDHVAWYSHRTIKTLLNRHGYEIKEFYWYNGRPKFSEGLVVVTE